MRLLLLVAMLSLGACARKVVVQTAPVAQPAVSLKVTNRADQALTIFVLYNGTEQQVGVVAAKTSSTVSVNDVPMQSTVRLRAALADGSRSYTREGVTLNGVFEWQVP